jgi:hypothetical protein
MNMLLKLGLGLLALLLGFVIYVAMKPSEFVVSREITIQAPPEKIFPYLNNSKLMNDWSPWPEVDPKAQMVFSGPPEGVGARTSWDSTGQLGTGSATIIESIPYRSVRTKLAYVKPFNMEQDAHLSIQPAGGGSVVTWSVSGRNPFFGRLMCSLMNMDKMVGNNFNKGLSKLKAMLENKR